MKVRSKTEYMCMNGREAGDMVMMQRVVVALQHWGRLELD